MNRPIDRPEALGRTLDVLNARWTTLIHSRRSSEDDMDKVAGELMWCRHMLKMYRDIAVVEFLRAIKRVHDAGGPSFYEVYLPTLSEWTPVTRMDIVMQEGWKIRPVYWDGERGKEIWQEADADA